MNAINVRTFHEHFIHRFEVLHEGFTQAKSPHFFEEMEGFVANKSSGAKG